MKFYITYAYSNGAESGFGRSIFEGSPLTEEVMDEMEAHVRKQLGDKTQKVFILNAIPLKG